MSFVLDLEPHFDVVQKHAQDRRKGLEELVQLLRERAMYEDFYAIGLDKVANHDYQVTCQGDLARLVEAMKEECGIRATESRKLSTAIFEELIHPLFSLLQSQCQSLKSVHSSARTSKKKLATLLDNLEMSKQLYYAQFRSCEETMLKLESAKSSSDKKKALGVHTPTSLTNSMQATLSAYKDALKTYNDYVPKHHEKVLQALSNYEKMEEERLEAMGSSIHKLWELSVQAEEAILDRLKDRFQVLPTQTYQHFYPQYDISQFVLEAKSTPSDPAPISQAFYPYLGSHPSFSSLADTLPTLSWPTDDQSIGGGNDLESARIRLEKLMNRAWGDVLMSRELGEIREIVKEKKGRKLWVSFMNGCRAEGKFRLSYQGFCSVAEIMNIVLDECEATNDIATSKSCIILSQTFHHLRGAEKEFLQSKIVTHTLWRREDIWDAIVKDGIDCEVEKRRQCGGESAGTDHSNLVFGQLSSYAYVMSLFGVDEVVARIVLEKHCKHYHLSLEETSLLIGITSPESSPTDTALGSHIDRTRSVESAPSLHAHSRHHSLHDPGT